MAAIRVTCNLVQAGSLQLKQAANLKPVYTSLMVLPPDKVMVVERGSKNILVFHLHDGHLLAVSNRLDSPCDICICSIRDDEIQVAVCFRYSAVLEVLSIKSTRKNSIITVVKKLNVRTEFHSCHGVKYWNEKLLICGKKKGNIFWGIVSVTDGNVDIVHNVCKCEDHSMSYLSTTPHDDNTVYILCDAGDKYLDSSGVYGYRNSMLEFLYQHTDLDQPRGITVDIQGYIFVCNLNPSCIHHLTEKGQLVTIYREDMPSDFSAIYCEEQQGLLYITSEYSDMIRIYRPVYSDQQGLPREILNMDKDSIRLFEEALKDGKENIYRIRVMVVGHLGVGKTTLIKRLLGEEVDITRRCSTEGIDVHLNCCNVSLATHAWIKENKGTEEDYLLQRFVRVVSEKRSTMETHTDKESIVTPHERESTPDTKLHDVDKSTQDCHFPQKDTEQNQLSTASHQNESDSDQRNLTQSDKDNMTRNLTQSDTHNTVSNLTQSDTHMARNLTQSDTDNAAIESQKKDQTREMIQLLRKKSDTLKPDGGKYALLTVYDFAGQYAYYTTHQMFLSRRAIYLLVSDVSRHTDDLVQDECYFDSKGRRKCRVHELAEFWLNSIHSCSPTKQEEMNSSYSHKPSDAITPPPVILVGTHVDLIPQRPFGYDIEEAKQSQMSQSGMLITSIAPQPPLEQPRASTSHDSTLIPSLRQQRKRRGTSQAVSSSIKKAPKTKGQMQAIETKRSDENETKDYRSEICERYFRQIRSRLSKPTRVHLVDDDFAIDNTVIDSKLENLKRTIVKVATQQPYWGEQIPARWLYLEQELLRCKADGKKVISRKDVENLNKEGAVPIEKMEELDLFLRFLHETGTVIYFNIEVLRENIVLDPEWLIDALKSLINAHPVSPSDDGALSDNPADRDAENAVIQKWSDFKEKGKLTLEIIDAVWTKENTPDLYDKKEHILLLMEELNIIAKPRTFNEHGEKVENYFLAPCMLQLESPGELVSPEKDPQTVSTSVLCCSFTEKFLPPPIFHRLLAACIAKWPVAKKKETSENLIFCGCCVFDLDLFHRLTLHYRNHVLYARITRMVIDEAKKPDAKLCTRVRKFITLNLTNTISYLGQNLEYELGVLLPPSQDATKDGIVHFAPFQIWFEHEGHDLDAPITPEHMNYARLCIAIVSVCGNALREILLTNFPVPYKNIYQAILANQAKLTGLRGRPLLNMDQSQLVFPDPKQQYTGKVDKFDISLLYTLIRNVSMVPPPLTGWGCDPQDQPRDKTLGASVERIRLYRNDISGHSADGKIIKDTFEDYWIKINAVLCDIEDVIGRQVYSLELEKQKRQVISIYEAC